LDHIILSLLEIYTSLLRKYITKAYLAHYGIDVRYSGQH